MLKRRIVTIVLLGVLGLLVCISITTDTPLSRQLLTIQVKASSVSVVSVGESMGLCSGVIVAEREGEAYVLTAKHCYQPNTELFVDSHPASLFALAPHNDLALLTVQGRVYQKVPSQVAHAAILGRGRIITVGYPQLMERVRFGNALFRSRGLLWARIDIIPGCSGGGVFNTSGQLIGIVSKGFPNRPLGIFEDIDEIRKFLLKENLL